MAVDLETRLQELADSLEFPGADDLTDRVVATLSQPGTSVAPVVPLRRRPLVRRLVTVAAAAVLIAAIVLTVSGRARHAVADLLGIGGVEIRRGASASTSAPRPAAPNGTGPAATSVPGPASTSASAPPSASSPAAFDPDALGLGRAVALSDGARRLGIPPPVPTPLGAPRSAYFGERPAGSELTLVWSRSSTLPSTSIRDVGALLTVFRGGVDENFIAKLLPEGTTYERVTVNGQPAVWLAGAPHEFLYEKADGTIDTETLRLAGNTLIWTRGLFTYRLESALGRDAAIEVAASVPV